MTVNFSNQEKVASPVNFYPSGITFLFNAGFYLFPGISLMYEHSCSHPIIPYLPWNSGISILDGGFDRVYLEIKGKINY
jgi:hypothetical protein